MISIAPPTDAQVTYLFNLVDTDKSGKISQQEVVDFATQAGVTIPGYSLDFVFNYVDTNGDGQCSLSEILTVVHNPPTAAQYFTALFNKVDANADGKLTITEITTFVSKMAHTFITVDQLKIVLTAMDTSKDGTVDKNELLAFFGATA